MMQAADLGKGNDGPGTARLNRPGDRAVLAQSQMRARAVIIGDVRRKDPPQLRLVEDDDVVEALSPARASRPATQPITLSAKGFCQGERGAVTTSSMPMALILARNTKP